MAELRRTYLDVSNLPRHALGPREITWWGNLGFMVVEGTTLIICAVVYLYLRRNFDVWPPLRTSQPDLIIPTLSLMALLITTFFAHLEGQAAKQADVAGIKLWALVGVSMDLIVLTMRALELNSLDTRWDNDAYGSIVWFTIGFHATLLLLVFLEDFFYALVAFLKPIDEKQRGHIVEKAEYGYFVAGIWIPLYVLIYLSPRFL